MRKNRGIYRGSICAAALLAALAFTANLTVFASRSSFSKGYGFGPDVSAMKKADESLNGMIFDGTEMKTGDYILPEGGIPNFSTYYNGINNIFVWQEYTKDGVKSYRKVYGGGGTYNGCYNYAENGNCAMNKSTPSITAFTNRAVNTQKGGPYIISPDSGYVSYGYYDVKLNDYNELTVLLSSYNELPRTKLQLVQGKAEDSDICEKSVDLITLESSGEVKLFDSNESMGQIINNGYYNNVGSYYVIKYILDARGSILKHSIEIRKYDDNSLIASSKTETIKDMDFDTNDLMGFRLETKDDIANNVGARLALDEFKLVKAESPLGMVTTQSSLQNNKISFCGGDVVFEFDRPIDSSKMWEGSVYALDESGQGVPLTYNVSGKNIIVTFGELEPEAKYTVCFNDILPLTGGGFTGSMDVY